MYNTHTDLLQQIEKMLVEIRLDITIMASNYNGRFI